MIILFALFIGGFLWMIDSNFSRLQLMALEAVGQAPPPTPFASDFASRGMEFYAAGNMREAAAMYERAVAQQPTNVDYLYEYGRALLELGAEDASLFPQVIDLGDRAINAAPRDPRGYALKTRALDLAGDSANAIPVGQQGLTVDPNFAPLHYALSDAYRSIDRYDVALERAERAIELDPYDPTARRIYAYALTWVGDRDGAIEQLERAVALNPAMTGPYFELAVQYLATQEMELAIATYEQILAMQPENARAYQRLCEAYNQAGEIRRAIGYCQDSLGINDRSGQAWASYGHVQYRNRNYEGAIESFETCIALASEDIRCWYLRGLAHYYLGECEQAWSVLSEAADIVGQPVDYNPVYESIMSGFQLINQSCTGFQGRGLPTALPPTAIPPTPIGG
ncbi:MAG: tetratricopeptide repeat protein [bacterium]|nr:tetratricopeptide repeat protein [bacterium]